MTSQITKAFFFGRALAEVLTEKAEHTLTDLLSEIGKFDAEQRENLRQLIEEVQARAEKEANLGIQTNSTGDAQSPADLQEMVDDLRAEIARLRAELKKHQSSEQPQ